MKALRSLFNEIVNIPFALGEGMMNFALTRYVVDTANRYINRMKPTEDVNRITSALVMTTFVVGTSVVSGGGVLGLVGLAATAGIYGTGRMMQRNDKDVNRGDRVLSRTLPTITQNLV